MRIRRFLARGAEAGEIRDDALATQLEAVAADPRTRTILEIGSATGAGSTAALVRGLHRNPDARLVCLEAVPERFRELQRRYRGEERVLGINASSVGVDGFASDAEVRGFHATLPTALSPYSLDEVLRWLDDDLASSAAAPSRPMACSARAQPWESRSSTRF